MYGPPFAPHLKCTQEKRCRIDIATLALETHTYVHASAISGRAHTRSRHTQQTNSCGAARRKCAVVQGLPSPLRKGIWIRAIRSWLPNRSSHSNRLRLFRLPFPRVRLHRRMLMLLPPLPPPTRSLSCDRLLLLWVPVVSIADCDWLFTRQDPNSAEQGTHEAARCMQLLTLFAVCHGADSSTHTDISPSPLCSALTHRSLCHPAIVSDMRSSPLQALCQRSPASRSDCSEE